MQLLVSTPRFLLEYDTLSSRTRVLDSGRGEYYGISWDPSGTNFSTSHSLIENDSIRTLEDYANSEVGAVSIAGRVALGFLSSPHQILWIDSDHLVATNTGRNTFVCFNTRTQFSRQQRVGSALWDRLSAETFDGVHLNSFFFKNGTLYVVANNFTKGSFICEYSWPQLELKARHPTPNLSGLHNLYIDDDDLWITCDSHFASLANARSGKCLWMNGGQGLTRGLAATAELFFVGHSEKSGRSLRTGTESGIWVIDRATLKTRDYIYLGHFGCVNEVRIGSEPDLAHHGVPLQARSLDFLADKSRSLTERRLKHAGRIRAVIGTLDHVDDRIAPKGGEFLLGLTPDRGQDAVGICARLNFGPVDNTSASHAGLVARYHGPEDQNMVAVIFQLDDCSRISAGMWTSIGKEWRQHSSMSVTADLIEMINGQRTLQVSLHQTGDVVLMTINGKHGLSISEAESSLPSHDGGRYGVRMQGSGITLSELTALGRHAIPDR